MNFSNLDMQFLAILLDTLLDIVFADFLLKTITIRILVLKFLYSGYLPASGHCLNVNCPE